MKSAFWEVKVCARERKNERIEREKGEGGTLTVSYSFFPPSATQKKFSGSDPS